MIGYHLFTEKAAINIPFTKQFTLHVNPAVCRMQSPRKTDHSHVFDLNPNALAFSDTARLIWSDAPDGKSALISSVMFSEALGSPARILMISSAT